MTRTASAPPEMADLEMRAAPRPGTALKRWWPLVVLGAGVVVGLTYLLLAIFPGRYTATGVLEIDQPTITATGSQGLDATQKLLDLVPTLTSRATADDVLNRVKADTGYPGALRDMRNQLHVTALSSQLAMSISATDSKAPMAEALAVATIREFRSVLQQEETTQGIPPSFQLTITELTGPVATQADQHLPRTLALAGVVGLIVLGGLVVLVDYLRTT